MAGLPLETYVAVNLRSGAQLLRLLYEIDCRSQGGMRLYRGHADTAWSLTPGLFRESDEETNVEVLKGFERRLLSSLQSKLKHETTTPERLLDNPDYLLSLAQHYGGLTRCLDWTASPMQATYFAAAGSVTSRCERALCVFTTSAFRFKFRIDDDHSRLLNSPAAENHHIRAQNGRLVLHGWNDRNHWPSEYDEVTSDDLDRILGARVAKIGVPSSTAAWLLDQLRHRGIDGAQAFPGNRGHVQFALEQAMMFTHPNVTWTQYGEVDDEDYVDYDDVKDAD